MLGHGQQQVETQALNPRHGGNGLALFLTIEHEHRVDQVVDRDMVFAHQAAGEVIAAQAAQAGGGELGRCRHPEIVPQRKAG